MDADVTAFCQRYVDSQGWRDEARILPHIVCTWIDCRLSDHDKQPSKDCGDFRFIEMLGMPRLVVCFSDVCQIT